MIRNTVKRTIAATWVVKAPDPNNQDFPSPIGTGFFASPDGLFVTASHVATVATEPQKLAITHETEPGEFTGFGNPEIVTVDENLDIALLKFDVSREPGGVAFLEIETGEQVEGTPVYSFGFPLPEVQVEHVQQPGISMYLAQTWICPRVTSAIISSRHEYLGPMQIHGPPDFYVFDKAFNYGNSGGP